MILAIDTSSSEASVVVLRDRIYQYSSGSRTEELMPVLRRVTHDSADLEKVAVAVGPGSFTGLRVGVSFAVGLAMGRGVPIVPLGSLELQAARSDDPVTAVIEAGRGRFYFKVGEGPHQLGSPSDIPASLGLVGSVSERGKEALSAAGLSFARVSRLRSRAEGAIKLLETASEVAYGSLEIEYMQSFGARS